MAQIKYSQKSILGLEAALLALNTAVVNSGAGGSAALVDAINTEVTARNGAISTAIATEVTNRNTAIDTAIHDVIGSAPAAFDTLKEIADYITVNPNASVAAAITAAVATVQASVNALSGVVDAEKTYLDNVLKSLYDVESSQIILNAGHESLAAAFFSQTSDLNLEFEINQDGTIPLMSSLFLDSVIEQCLNFNRARLTTTLGLTVDLRVNVNAGVAAVMITKSEWLDIGTLVGAKLEAQFACSYTAEEYRSWYTD